MKTEQKNTENQPVFTDENSYCGEYAKTGKCENGHRYIKVIYCGKEYCENCRELIHNRRIARWLPKALTMESFGYFVFTVPEEMREFYKDKTHLSELRTYLRRRLKQVYPGIKALCRWHFFGDNPYIFHPHFNVIVSSFEKLSKEELESIKQDYKRALERFTGIKLDKKINIHYKYCSPKGFKKQYTKKHKTLTDEQAQELYHKALYHKLRYITRPTFTVYHQELAKKLKNFRNCSVWGKFRDLTYEEIEAMQKQHDAFSKKALQVKDLEAGFCPMCGAQVHWERGRKVYHTNTFLKGYECTEIGEGYYLLGKQKIRGSPTLNPEKIKIGLREVKQFQKFLSGQSAHLWNWLEDWEKQEKQRVDING